MAAALQVSPRVLKATGEEIIMCVRLTTMTADQIENVSYAVIGQAPPRKPQRVDMQVVTRPTAPCVLQLVCNPDAAVAASQYVPVRVTTEAGGGIAGAAVDIYLHFNAVSSGGMIVDPFH